MEPWQAYADEARFREHARDFVGGEADAVRVHPAVGADIGGRGLGRGIDEGAGDEAGGRERSAEIAQAAYREFAQGMREDRLRDDEIEIDPEPRDR